jgi:hypothetical protein
MCRIAAVIASRRCPMRARRRRCCVAVQFQVELAFESVLDRLDELADRFEQVLAPVRGAVAVGRV